MFSCSRTETKLIADGTATGVTAKYHDVCPHKVGNYIIFTSKFIPGNKPGAEAPFARAVVTSVRPGTVGKFRDDKNINKIDGFKSSASWFGHLDMKYKGAKDDERVWHISFKIEEMIK